MNQKISFMRFSLAVAAGVALRGASDLWFVAGREPLVGELLLHALDGVVGEGLELLHQVVHSLEHGEGLLVDLRDGEGCLAKVVETLGQVPEGAEEVLNLGVCVEEAHGQPTVAPLKIQTSPPNPVTPLTAAPARK